MLKAKVVVMKYLYFRELTAYPSTNASETLMEVAQHFYLNFKIIKDVNFNVMINTICHLTNVAVTYCKEGKFLKQFVQCLINTVFKNQLQSNGFF